jgi:hypothetical protein
MGTTGEITSNHEISKGKQSCKSKDRQLNVQKFGFVKGEVTHGKANRVHIFQWT